MAFFDHFDDASIHSRWTAVTEGSGTVTESGSIIETVNNNNADAAYFYYNTQINTTDTGLWLVCANFDTDGGWRRFITLRETTTPGSALNYDSDNSTIIRIELPSDGTDWDLNLQYYDTGGTRQNWNPNTQAFTTGNVFVDENRTNLDNFFVVGIELDGTNERFRMLAWTLRAPGTAYVFEQGGPRLMQLTDWVDFADAQTAQNNMYLQFGDMYNDLATGGTKQYEWIRHEDGAREEAWANGRTDNVDNYDIRHWYTFGDVFVPQDRTSIAIDLGAGGAWDDVDVKDPFVVLDGSDYRFFYDGSDGNFQIGAATTTNPDSAPTKDAGNPIVTPPSGTTDVFFPYVVYDQNDATNPWKMLAAVVTTGGAFRIHYFTASSYNGTWTDQGAVLQEGGVGDDDETGVTNPVILWDSPNNQWIVFYAQKRPDPSTSANIEDVSYATGPYLDQLTKSGSTLITWQSDGDEDITANLSGRTATISSNSGFTADAIVLVNEDNTANDWSMSRIRAVNAGDLELYHHLEGFTSAAPARIIQADRAHGMYLRHVEQVGSTWKFYGVIYRYYVHVSGRNSFAETSALWTHTNADPVGATPSLENLLYPNISQTYFGHERSSENITLATSPLTINRSLATPRRSWRGYR